MEESNTYTAFAGSKLFCCGALTEVALKVKRHIGKAEHGEVLIFSDATGKAMDFNFQGSEKDVLKRLKPFAGEEGLGGQDAAGNTAVTGPGRPRLGVISREVSLQPRQWEWLASQSGSASAILRRLVDEARKKAGEGNSFKQLQEKTYKFMSVMAGDLRGYEEALRALYKKDEKGFLLHTEEWPRDVRAHAAELAAPVFAGGRK